MAGADDSRIESGAMGAPTYRERLRTEGLTLAGSAAVVSALILAFTKQSRRWPLNTIGQLALVAVLLLVLGPRSARRAMADAEHVRFGRIGDGQPTALWKLPATVAALGATLRLLAETPNGARRGAGWDAALRATAGPGLVGLAQAYLIEHEVARDEAERGRSYYRLPGSQLGKGTKLGYTTRWRVF
jgi:hypothetical protein